MANLLMNLGGIILVLLFLFILFTSIVIILSNFMREKFRRFEPGVSVIIPCYNEEKNISACLDSVFAADYPKNKLEVIIVDDGSTDSTPVILSRYQKKVHNLTVIKGHHKGKSEALNLGAKKVRFEFLLTIDADTVIKKDSIKKMLAPFSDSTVGATNGSCMVGNPHSLLAIFQNMEYVYNNLIRKSFSAVFQNGIWFFGAFACYRKSVLKKTGYFKKHTLAEDMDTNLEIYAEGFRVMNVHDAYGYTIVPTKFKDFVNQRTRWWLGVLQSLGKNNKLFSRKSSPSIIFLFVNQYWWTFYALISIPLIAYQYSFWLNTNTDTFLNWFLYTFRWFSLLGPIHVIYMIPKWGISFYNIFGVLSGILSTTMMIYALIVFKEKFSLRNAFVLFFYFPYTIVLNATIAFSIVRAMVFKKKYFIK